MKDGPGKIKAQVRQQPSGESGAKQTRSPSDGDSQGVSEAARGQEHKDKKDPRLFSCRPSLDDGGFLEGDDGNQQKTLNVCGLRWLTDNI